MLIEKPAARAAKAGVDVVEAAYRVLVPLWHQGILRAEGEIVSMTEAGAKYMMHALSRVTDSAPEEKAPDPVATTAKPGVTKTTRSETDAPADA